MSSPLRRLRGPVALFLARLALWLSARLPLSLSRRLGRWFARRYWAMNGRGRRVAERNIALAYPELPVDQQVDLARASVEETGALAAEMGHVWYGPWERTRNLILDVEGVELVRSAVDAGRGVIVLAPHLGNWEVLGLHLATLGDTVALFEPPKIVELGSLIQRARERSGGRLVPTTPRGIAALTKSVKGGGISGILPDQVPDSPVGAVNVPFMGVECATATLAWNLVRRTGAAAVMGVAFRIPGGFRVCYTPAPAEIHEDDPQIALGAMNTAIADLLQGRESQYQWQYKRFRCRPAGPVDHYQNL